MMPSCRLICADSGEPTSGLEPLTPAHYELACGCPDVHHRVTRGVAYLSPIPSRGGVARPTTYRPVPARLQYRCTKSAFQNVEGD